MNPPKEARNKLIVLARDTYPDVFTWGVLAEILNVKRPTVREIYLREKGNAQ